MYTRNTIILCKSDVSLITKGDFDNFVEIYAIYRKIDQLRDRSTQTPESIENKRKIWELKQKIEDTKEIFIIENSIQNPESQNKIWELLKEISNLKRRNYQIHKANKISVTPEEQKEIERLYQEVKELNKKFTLRIWL